MIYQQTPDFYNEYISHSAVWEGRSRYRNGEDELEHGWAKDAAAKAHKYIDRWRGKNGKWYYRYKSKAQELGAKINRKINGVTLPGSVTDNYGHNFKRVYVGDRIEDGNIISSRSGRAGSRKIATTKISSKVSRKPKKKGNLTSRGYSGSQGSGESQRQRNLGTRKVAGSNRYGTTIRVKDPYHKPQFESLSGPGSDGYTFTEPGWYWRDQSLKGMSRRQDRNAVKIEVYTVKNKKKKR